MLADNSGFPDSMGIEEALAVKFPDDEAKRKEWLMMCNDRGIILVGDMRKQAAQPERQAQMLVVMMVEDWGVVLNDAGGCPDDTPIGDALALKFPKEDKLKLAYWVLICHSQGVYVVGDLRSRNKQSQEQIFYLLFIQYWTVMITDTEGYPDAMSIGDALKKRFPGESEQKLGEWRQLCLDRDIRLVGDLRRRRRRVVRITISPFIVLIVHHFTALLLDTTRFPDTLAIGVALKKHFADVNPSQLGQWERMCTDNDVTEVGHLRRKYAANHDQIFMILIIQVWKIFLANDEGYPDEMEIELALKQQFPDEDADRLAEWKRICVSRGLTNVGLLRVQASNITDLSQQPDALQQTSRQVKVMVPQLILLIVEHWSILLSDTIGYPDNMSIADALAKQFSSVDQQQRQEWVALCKQKNVEQVGHLRQLAVANSQQIFMVLIVNIWSVFVNDVSGYPDDMAMHAALEKAFPGEEKLGYWQHLCDEQSLDTVGALRTYASKMSSGGSQHTTVKFVVNDKGEPTVETTITTTDPSGKTSVQTTTRPATEAEVAQMGGRGQPAPRRQMRVNVPPILAFIVGHWCVLLPDTAAFPDALPVSEAFAQRFPEQDLVEWQTTCEERKATQVGHLRQLADVNADQLFMVLIIQEWTDLLEDKAGFADADAIDDALTKKFPGEDRLSYWAQLCARQLIVTVGALREYATTITSGGSMTTVPKFTPSANGEHTVVTTVTTKDSSGKESVRTSTRPATEAEIAKNIRQAPAQASQRGGGQVRVTVPPILVLIVQYWSAMLSNQEAFPEAMTLADAFKKQYSNVDPKQLAEWEAMCKEKKVVQVGHLRQLASANADQILMVLIVQVWGACMSDVAGYPNEMTSAAALTKGFPKDGRLEYWLQLCKDKQAETVADLRAFASKMSGASGGGGSQQTSIKVMVSASGEKTIETTVTTTDAAGNKSVQVSTRTATAEDLKKLGM